MIHTVTMNPAVDLILSLGALQPGALHRAETEQAVFGGKGVNVSLVLRELGVPSVARGFSAGFTGEALEAHLASLGIEGKFTRLLEGFTRINVKLTGAADTEINCAGPEVPDEALRRFLDGLKDDLQPGDILVLSGSVPRGVPQNVYALAAKAAREKGARFTLDASGALLSEALPLRPFLVKPNRDELSAFFGAPCLDDGAVLCAMRKMQDRGAENVLASLGGDGALLLAADGAVYRAPAAKGTVVSTTAAGDSMLAGFLAANERGMNMPEAFALGTASGGAAAFSVGTPHRAEIDAILQTVQGEVRRIG